MTTADPTALTAAAAAMPDGSRILNTLAHYLGDATSEWRRREMWRTLATGPVVQLSREDGALGLLLLQAAADAGDAAASTDANEVRTYLAPRPSFGDSDGDALRAEISKASMVHSDMEYRLSQRHYGRR